MTDDDLQGAVLRARIHVSLELVANMVYCECATSTMHTEPRAVSSITRIFNSSALMGFGSFEAGSEQGRSRISGNVSTG